MTAERLLTQLLRMKGFRVTWYEICPRKKEIHVGVKPHKTGCLCTECGRRGKIVAVLNECRERRDIILCGMLVIFHYNPKEIECETHGRRQEKIPWADAFERVTYRFEYVMLALCRMMTQLAAAELLHIAKSTLSDLLHRTIKRLREGHRIRGLKSIGIDEISYCLDHLHITKALLAAVDEVRKEEWRNADKSDRSALKGLRWLLFRHSSNRTKGHTRTLNRLKRSNLRIHRAWVLKDEFEKFRAYSYRGSAETFLKGWMTAALKSRLQPLRDFVKTLKNHMEYVIAYIKTPISNAVGEGLNRVIRLVKNRAGGFRSLDALSDIIYPTVGDVDIPGQIPPHFRTL